MISSISLHKSQISQHKKVQQKSVPVYHCRKVDHTYDYPTEKKLLPEFNLARSSSSWTTQEDLQYLNFEVFNIGSTKKKQRKQYQSVGESKILDEELWSIDSKTIDNIGGEKYQLPTTEIAKASSFKKPQPFMGAFIQTQNEFSCFNLNISIPSLSEYKPFSRILEAGDFTHSKLQTSYEEENQNRIEDQKELKLDNNLLDESNDLEIYVEPRNISDIWSLDLNLSRINQLEEEQILYDEANPNNTFFQNFDQLLFATDKGTIQQSLLWDDPATANNVAQSFVYQFHPSKVEPFIQKVSSMMQIKSETKLTSYISEHELCASILRMLEGVESEMFTLDYNSLEWYFNHGLNIRLENHLVQSLSKHLKDILLMANYKSRIQRALQYIKKEKYRRIFQEVGSTVNEVLLIIEEVCLEAQARKDSLLEFVTTVSEFLPEINLLYEILINQKSIKEMDEDKTLMDFDYTFLNPEALIFKQIIRISSSNDNLAGRLNQIALKLLRATFKPITFTLNRIVFQETVEISNFDETYLRYYFESMKDMLTFLGKRIQLIKQESNELYLICRIKEEIKIVVDLQQLKDYDAKWKIIFQQKREMIKEIQRREKKKAEEEKQKKHEQKVKEISELKIKLQAINEQTKKYKKHRKNEGAKEMEMLKKEIAHREETRRLNELIQKQQEKGFLLDLELKEKRQLIRQKEELLKEAEVKGLSNMLVEKIVVEEEDSQFKSEQNIMTKRQSQQQNSQTLSIKTYDIPSALEQAEINNETIYRSEVKESKVPQQKNRQQEENMQNKTYVRNLSNGGQKQQNNGNDQQQRAQDAFQSGKQSESGSQQNQQPDQDTLHVSTNTVLQTCIDNVIRQQIDTTYLALSYLIYDRYQLPSIIEFMRKIFLTGNGETVSDFLGIAVNYSNSNISLKHFNQCILFDDYTVGERARKGPGNMGPESGIIEMLEPEFYEMGQYENRSNLSIYHNKQVNMFHESLELHVGFQFKRMPSLLEPYFSYIHLSKYMQIFSHILKIRHSCGLLSQALLELNQIKRQILEDKDPQEVALLNKLYKTRYIAQAFLNTLQNFLYYRVIEKQIKNFKKKLIKEELAFLNELSPAHLRMLDNIIKFGLIENPLRDISKRIKLLLGKVREFKNIVDMFCEDDVPEYIRGEVESQVDKMYSSFGGEQRFLEMLFYHP